ncbi:Transposase (or an inactivated derivative) [Nitrosomonas sp. Nm51]|uniref:IS256 family transposase n=1 Tax=Nitrosomonas sp. Nm51 TaxID=133720 RepID=UPI0008C84642|nr:IS256 family transposase [Nitrosomonas sp. Nm51]SER86107.1 Transposase (or an inactivated derivative) [Nitrosomonas sp. Nm51]
MSKIIPQFDFEEALEALKAGQDLNGKNGILTPLIKQLTEAALAAEVERHIESKDEPNRKNGSTPKTMKSASGSFQLDTPRDRNGTFEPQLVKKHQTHFTDEMERKILSLFALGSSYEDISGHIAELYGIDISPATISAVTGKLIPELREWQQRPLDSHYPFVWLDAIHFKVREDGRYVSKAVYSVLGVNIEGKKEILGLYLSESEGARFWLSVLTDLNNRGVQDILIAAIDGLTGFPEAINSIFPNTGIQLCIIHQIRNTMKYVASKNHKALMADLKRVYKAQTKEAAESALDTLEAKWGKQCPITIKSWRSKWDNLSVFFKYPEPIRRVMYTTNAIEAVHRQFRKLTKTKGGFPNENSLLKLLYVGIKNASRKWTMPFPNWNLTLSQLVIYFEGRLDAALDL